MAFGVLGGDLPSVEARLSASVETYRPGVAFEVALDAEMTPGWHTYWQNPGDSGQPPTVRWTAPRNWIITGPRWPAPQRIEAGGIVSYGYEDSVRLVYEVIPVGTGEARIEAAATWLVCKDTCVPVKTVSRMTLLLGSGDERAEWPRVRPLKTLVNDAVKVSAAGDGYVLAVRLGPVPEDYKPYFYPSDEGLIDHAAGQNPAKNGETWTFRLKKSPYAKALRRFRGVIAPETPGSAAETYRLDVPL